MTKEKIVYVVREQSFSPGLAGVFSFLVPGLGQLYKGQLFNGLLWFFLVVAGYICFVVPGLILHLLCILGAMKRK